VDHTSDGFVLPRHVPAAHTQSDLRRVSLCQVLVATALTEDRTP
jgi:hypothetical protein